jgi:hypothetical protein
MTAGAEGGCACGQVRYRLLPDPIFVHCCHCHLCQQQTGSAFVLHALIETERVELLSGQTALFPMPTGSGLSHVVARCRACGTQLWSYYHGADSMSFLKVGTLDDPAAMPPAAHIHTASKLPWVVLPSGVPTFEAGYDFRSLWPPESLARARAPYI